MSRSDFVLTEQPVLSRSALDRDEDRRSDPDWPAATWAKARVVVVDEAGRTPVDWETAPGSGFREADAAAWDRAAGRNGHVRTRAGADLADAPPAEAVLLGERDGVPYWAVRGGPARVAADDPGEWADLRAAGAFLDPLGAGLLTGAVATLNWHDRARFCAVDGTRTRPQNAGWARICENGHEEYPRTDPAIICLVHDGGDRVLLGRQPSWPVGRYSVLAGFVESGESLEACVQREIAEEVGIAVTGVTYLGSQAWPFPRSLMVGFHAVGDPDAPLRLQDGEIADALWVSRSSLRTALARGDWAQPEQGREDGTDPVVMLPGRVSIARTMLESWAAAGD
ncbi:NAD(+) diphosphatase [Pseudonocardia sp. HH130630-07]|uniref:NAD(+) diphosphatase n=1 Tax=Pseudonocardia sp. HH130630-07 TaxID=1690815 RepID=UPI000814FE4A|nr:NAD(+) diphosphatase [Pseudonocardia sp. HH130630-07]ANY05897.1 NADH pyrophosphatase [Pseudonocardia sp. HH130630-07]